MSATSGTTDSTSTQERDPGAGEAAWANLYHLLSRAFASPLDMSDECPAQLRDLLDSLPPGLQESGAALADEWGRALSGSREVLLVAYARLFVGPFEVLAPPYASFYLEPDQRIMGALSQEVANWYGQAGLGPGDGPREAPDHVALEWEFMYFLTHQLVVTGDEAWRTRRQRFQRSHLDRWMPAFAKAMGEADTHRFYNALASLLRALAETETPA